MQLQVALSGLSDEQWLTLLLSENPSIGGTALPTLPPFEIQKRSNRAANREVNLRAALRFYQFVRDRCGALSVPLTPVSRVLDFGCGWGRVLRFFLREVSPEGLFGVDVDAKAIGIARETNPLASFTNVERHGPTPFADACFDLVYAVSVFSHLPEDLHFTRLREITRVLKPGGLLIATTLRPAAIQYAASLRASGKLDDAVQKAIAASFPEGSEAEIEAGRYLYGPYPLPEYGMTIIPRAYVEREWRKYLDVLDYVDDPDTFGQAIIVARKRT